MTIKSTHEELTDRDSIRLIVDSGATQHLINRFNLLTNWHPFVIPRPVITSTGQALQAMGTGDARIYSVEHTESPGILIKGAFYVPSLTHNLLSVSVMEERGLTVRMGNGTLSIQDSGGEFLTGKRENGLYVITAKTRKGSARHVVHSTDLRDNISGEQDFNCLTSEPKVLSDIEKLPHDQKRVWITAMNTEVNNFDTLRIWTPTTLTEGESPISSRWVFSLKKDEHGKTVKVRARLVARGFQQIYGHQFDEIYAPVVRSTTFRTLITMAAQRSWTVQHVDVDSAFLYGELKERILMTPPKGPPDIFTAGTVYKLRAAIYGLRQAARAWYTRITISLERIHFYATNADPCLFKGTQHYAQMYVIIHVDDLLILGPDRNKADQVIGVLKEEYHIKDLGQIRCYLGQHVIHDSSQGIYFLHQRDKIEALIHDLHLDQVAPYNIPLPPDYMKSKMNDQSEPFKDKTLYQSVLGSLMYLANVSRPDISLAANIMGRSASNPSTLDWQQLIRIALYLKGTMHLSLPLGADPHTKLRSYADADWGGDPHTRRSTSGSCHLWGGTLLSWKTQRQKCVSLSTAEAEYVAAVEASRETVWLIQLFKEIDIQIPVPVSQNCDNQSTLALLGSLKNGTKSKHIEIKLNYLKELIDNRQIDMIFCPTKAMIADIFTKPLPQPRHRELRSLLGLRQVKD